MNRNGRKTFTLSPDWQLTITIAGARKIATDCKRKGDSLHLFNIVQLLISAADMHGVHVSNWRANSLRRHVCRTAPTCVRSSSKGRPRNDGEWAPIELIISRYGGCEMRLLVSDLIQDCCQFVLWRSAIAQGRTRPRAYGLDRRPDSRHIAGIVRDSRFSLPPWAISSVRASRAFPDQMRSDDFVSHLPKAAEHGLLS